MAENTTPHEPEKPYYKVYPYTLSFDELLENKIVLPLDPANSLEGLARDVTPYNADDFLSKYTDIIDGKPLTGEEIGGPVVEVVKRMEALYAAGVSLGELNSFLRGYYQNVRELPINSAIIWRSLVSYYNHIADTENRAHFSFPDAPVEPIQQSEPEVTLAVETPIYDAMWTPEDDKRYAADVAASMLGIKLLPKTSDLPVTTHIPRDKRSHRRSDSQH